MSKELRVSEINVDHDVQIREATNTDAINEYSEVIDDLPPVIVFRDKQGQNWLADGFHRYQAAIKAKKLRIKCDVRTGEKRDAILFACGANRDHGLRRTNADKRRAVQRLLDDPEWGKWSDGKVAEAAAVSRQFVSNLRGQVATVATSKKSNPEKTDTSENAPPKKRKGRDGKEYTAKEKKKTDSESGQVATVATSNEPAWMANVPVLNGLRSSLNQIIREIRNIESAPGLERLHDYRSHIIRDLDSAKLNLRGCTPECVCPYCLGNDNECRACKGCGWVTKTQFEQAPSEMRDEVTRLSTGGGR